MKHLVRMLLMFLVAYGIYQLMIYVEVEGVLNEKIIPVEGTTEAWIESFGRWATLSIYGSFAAGMLWYVLGQWVFKVNDWRQSGKRPVWLLLMTVPFALFVLSCVFTSRPQEGALYAYLFYFLNSHLTYYLATTLFSPSSFMYTPLGASTLRHWKLTLRREA